MKKAMTVLCVLLLCMSIMNAHAEQHRQTNFDHFSDMLLKPILEITDADWFYDTSALTPAQIAQDDESILLFAALAWNELFRYETTVQDNAVNSTMMAELYRAIKDGPAVLCFTACDPTAVCANILVATDGAAWWIEWNLEDHILRAMQVFGIEQYASDEEFLTDFVFNSLLYSSINGNALMGIIPPESITMAYGASSGAYTLFDALYEHLNGGSATPI